MNKRLLFISQHFYPETFRGNDVAFDMARRGVDVTVVCGIPNYPEGRFFDGYGLFKRRVEVVKGVKIIRMPVVPRGRGAKWQLVANFFSYFIVASLFVPFHILCNKRYDACFVQQLTPVMMSFPGVVFKVLTRSKLLVWVLDLWPESLKVAGGITNKYVLSFFGWFAKVQYRYADKILVSSNGFADNICSKGDYKDKIICMPNWADEALSVTCLKTIPILPEGFKVMFTGNIGEAQDFESILEAAKLLSADEQICIIVVGDGRKKEWLERQIELLHLGDRLFLMGRFDISYMPVFYDKSDCLLLALKDNEILNLTIPAKMQAYMSAGKPVVAMINGDAARLIESADCGIAVPASCPEKLVQAIRRLKALPSSRLRSMGMNGRAYSEEHFNKENILNDLYRLMFC